MAYYGPSGPSVQGQILDLTVVGCYNLKDTEWFSRQDPYVVIEYSGQKFRTRTDTDGGKNPSFNETFRISMIEGLREMSATVWNSNTLERDSYIGTTKILLNKVIESGYDDTQWPLTDARTRKSSGMLKLILHYAGAKTKPGKPEGNSYSYAAPPAAGYYGQPPPAYPPAAYPPAVPAYGPAHYPPQQPAAYPPPASQAYAPVYQAPPPVAYPPAPSGYGAPPPAQPSYYNHAGSAPPTYGAASAPPYPAYPPTGYSPSGYSPGGYSQYR
ncbi:hypothetical protein KC19_10G035300 [Ceratodon purpureus]|uniref:C2 domain-containing protein n=1 Tax=Ceratodon purpureus TaxID=3225 RepID=A0A8T0GJW5_CERPU|nr:hypothetical protein KC19_10G035300 [Ceratodon purpureus]